MAEGPGEDTIKLAHQHAQEAQELFNKVAPEFTGRAGGVQGSAIAMLLGTWLAGHYSQDGPEATRKARAQFLSLTVTAALRHCDAMDEQEGRKDTRQ